jgi:hypothetical protein
VENRPSVETSKLLRDELLFQRATQTYLWALPLINTLGMKFGSEKVFGAGYNILPVWKKRLDAKTLVTTPNSDVLYAMSYLDLGKDGPLVMEAPPMLQGILLDFWQRPGKGWFAYFRLYGPTQAYILRPKLGLAGCRSPAVIEPTTRWMSVVGAWRPTHGDRDAALLKAQAAPTI